MIALSVSDVTLSFGTDVILKDVSFSVNDGDRVGVIGVNGAGKTSLFKIINGIYTPDAGAVYVQKGHTIGTLEQNADLTALPPELTGLEYMYTAFPGLIALEGEIAALEAALAMASAEHDNARTMQLSEQLLEKNLVFAERGGLEFRSRCRGMLLRLGFDDELINQKIRTLSGGQYTRLSLGRLLATAPDILMLDEPTNHLDIDALAWLEGFIASYKKTVIIISHDRYFLDKTTNKTLQLQYGKARLYHGNYTATKDQQEAEAASLEKRYKEQQKEIAKIRANIEFQRRCNREHNFVTIRSKEKQLARMELVELAPKAPKDIRLSFDAETESAGDVIEAKELSFSYGGQELIKNLSFLVRRYERVMFLGPNGSGKSTLLRCMNNLETIDSGEIRIGGDALVTTGADGKPQYKRDGELRTLMLKMGMVFQDYNLFPHYTVLKNLTAPQMLVLGRSKAEAEQKARELLAKVGLSEKEREYPCNLSGGQCQRVAIARALCMDPDILCFDEPTSALDPQLTQEVLSVIRALADEKRTMIVVTHEMNFARDVADRVIYMENGLIVEDGPAKEVLGNNRSAAIKAFAGEGEY